MCPPRSPLCEKLPPALRTFVTGGRLFLTWPPLAPLYPPWLVGRPTSPWPLLRVGRIGGTLFLTGLLLATLGLPGLETGGLFVEAVEVGVLEGEVLVVEVLVVDVLVVAV